jgi:hypothetical protein
MAHPLGKKAQEKREELLEAALERARQHAGEMNRSMRCSGLAQPYGIPQHDECKGGPTNCLCECHD